MTLADRLELARALLKDTEYCVTDGQTIDDLIVTARQGDQQRIRALQKVNEELLARVGRQPKVRRRPTASEFWG